MDAFSAVGSGLSQYYNQLRGEQQLARREEMQERQLAEQDKQRRFSMYLQLLDRDVNAGQDFYKQSGLEAEYGPVNVKGKQGKFTYIQDEDKQLFAVQGGRAIPVTGPQGRQIRGQVGARDTQKTADQLRKEKALADIAERKAKMPVLTPEEKEEQLARRMDVRIKKQEEAKARNELDKSLSAMNAGQLEEWVLENIEGAQEVGFGAFGLKAGNKVKVFGGEFNLNNIKDRKRLKEAIKKYTFNDNAGDLSRYER